MARLQTAKTGTSGTALPLPTLVDSRGAVQLEADFDPTWQEAKEIGLGLNYRPSDTGQPQGYAFLLYAGAPSADDDSKSLRSSTAAGGSVASFRLAREANLPFEARILRNGVVLSEASIRVPEGPLSLLVRRDGDRLQFQVNRETPLEFFDVVPLTPTRTPRSPCIGRRKHA